MPNRIRWTLAQTVLYDIGWPRGLRLRHCCQTCSHVIHLRLGKLLARRVHTDGAKVLVQGREYIRDEKTNITPAIIDKIGRDLYLDDRHPIGILRKKIETHFPNFAHVKHRNPIVTPKQNFDDLDFPEKHPGRAVTDSYYINSQLMLRTHTSAHQLRAFKADRNAFLLSADVYRRDEIDASHYPVFHQMEGARLWKKGELSAVIDETVSLSQAMANSKRIQCQDLSTISTKALSTNAVQDDHTYEEALIISNHLKATLNTLILSIFGNAPDSTGRPLQVRWIDAVFPFTSPSFEVEVMYKGKWLEILGSGVIRHSILRRAGKLAEEKIGWAFGFGLERIAMALYDIPDIRLFWSSDDRFHQQFRDGEIVQFRSYSRYPSCWKDISFWLASGTSSKPWHEHNFNDIVRDVAGDLVESVKLRDDFVQTSTGRRSLCFRIHYRSMDRNLRNDEIDKLQQEIRQKVEAKLDVILR